MIHIGQSFSPLFDQNRSRIRILATKFAIAEMILPSVFRIGALVFIVSQETWSVENHPRCRKFSGIADAVRAIMARAAGEAARLTRVKAA
jgi:hypothetical protein